MAYLNFTRPEKQQQYIEGMFRVEANKQLERWAAQGGAGAPQATAPDSKQQRGQTSSTLKPTHG